MRATAFRLRSCHQTVVLEVEETRADIADRGLETLRGTAGQHDVVARDRVQLAHTVSDDSVADRSHRVESLSGHSPVTAMVRLTAPIQAGHPDFAARGRRPHSLHEPSH